MTIDLGIDLGTTNSAIALQEGATTRLLTGGDKAALLPSAVHVDAQGTVVVGTPAYVSARRHPADTATEFKRLMGTDEARTFPSSGKRMTPEELSTEVLRELLRWASADGGRTPLAAVITIPAMFQLPQSEATRRAAEAAGIAHAPLLQEPIAAAIAQSGAGGVRDGSWLVYDLGGGTFDVSLVRSRGGRLQVLDHGGDNHLGGRDFDRLIARSMADRIRRGGKLGEFKRTDPALSDAFNRLRIEAERSRIALSKEEETRFAVEDLARDFSFEAKLDRAELETLIEPLVARTAALCAELLSRNGLKASELRGLVMVGGPTLTPAVSRIIQRDLGIEARHHADPMTMVATGAAIFAATQRLPDQLRSFVKGATRLRLEYEAMTTNPSPLLAGEVLAPARLASLRVRRSDGGFAASAQLEHQAFELELELKTRELNAFFLEGVDAGGARVAVEPAQFTVLHGFSVAKPPLSQSVGVMLADNTVCWYLRKGTVLPARNTMLHSTTIALAKGHSGEAINVPLIQGESDRADRNKVIGVLRIVADKLTRDLPKGSEVQVSMSLDEFSRTTSRAFVPHLDQWFDDVVSFHLETRRGDEVGKGLAAQRARLAELEKLVEGLEAQPESGEPSRAQSSGADDRVKEIEALLEEGDRDSVDLADQMVRWMSRDIDRTEDGSRRQVLEATFAREYAEALKLTTSPEQAAERRQTEALAAELQHALKLSDFESAKRAVGELEALVCRLLRRLPGYWAAVFEHLCQRLERLALLQVATEPVQRGRALLQGGGRMSDLAQVCFDLSQLLPAGDREVGGELEAKIMSHVR